MNVLWVPTTWEWWFLWWLNKKPQVCLVNTENGDFARMDRTFQFWYSFLSLSPMPREQKEYRSMCVHVMCFIILFWAIYSLNVLIFFVVKCIFCSIHSKTRFCAHSIHLLTRDEGISIFYIVHYTGWAFQAPLGVHCSHSFRVNDTRDYHVQNQTGPLLFML